MNNQGSPIPSYGVSLNTTQVVDNVNLTTAVQEVPQIQTTVTENGPEVVSIVNAPFVQVTSVNGKTGDVTVDAKVEQFKTNKQYSEGSLCVNSGSLYIAERSFTSGTSFNSNDWIQVQGGGGGGASVQSDWKASNTSDPAYIKNKPTNLKQIDNTYIPFTQDEKTKLSQTKILTQQEKDKLATTEIFTSVEKNKLAGIETGAQRNVPQVQADWQQSNSSQPSFIKNKPNNLVTDSRYVHTDNNFTNELKDRVMKNYILKEEGSVKRENIDFSTFTIGNNDMMGVIYLGGVKHNVYTKNINQRADFVAQQVYSIAHGLPSGKFNILMIQASTALGSEDQFIPLPHIESAHHLRYGYDNQYIWFLPTYSWGNRAVRVFIMYALAP